MESPDGAGSCERECRPLFFMGYSVKIRQHDISDCGAACIASVSAYWGLRLPIAKIRLFSNTDSRGTTIKGIVDAARAFGFYAEGFRAQEASLYKIPNPSIVHLEKRSGLLHYAVLYGAKEGKVNIMDPLDGEMHTIKMEEFLQEWSGRVILLTPAKDFKKGASGESVVARMVKLVTSNRERLAKAFITSLLFTMASFAISLFMKIILDRIIPSGERVSLTTASILIALVFAISLLLTWVRSTILVKVGLKIDKELIGKYIIHMVKLPGIFYDARETGEITSRISDAAKIRSCITGTLSTVAISVFMLLFSLVAMFAISPAMAIPSLAAIPLFIIQFRIADRFNKRVRRTIMERGATFENRIIETVKSYLTIKYSGGENYFAGKCMDALSHLLESAERGARGAIISGAAAELTSRLLVVFVLWMGGVEVMKGNISIGELVAFFTIISLFTTPLCELANSSPEIREGTVAASRLFEILDLEAESFEGGVVLSGRAPQSLKLCGVGFSYPGRATLFREAEMEFRRGEISLVTGDSGCGKSTLVSLLTRLRKPTEGHISADDVNIENINLKYWRELIAVVPQCPSLFAGTLMENIAPGIEEPDRKRIALICRDLGLSTLIKSLPLGMESNIGEGGATLSGGQQQRVAIARAIYRDAPVLIIDEGTSNLDLESELLADRVIKSERDRGKIVIVVSHKENTKNIADRVYKMGQCFAPGDSCTPLCG